MLIPTLLFAVGLLFLIKGGDWFVNGAVGIAHRFHLPELLIGATVVSIGTTLPEVMVSAASAMSGHGEIAYGNAVGSIICNTALISAITIAVRPGPVDRKTLRTPTCFFFGAAALYMITGYVVGEFHRPIGFLLLGIFVVYMIVTVLQMQKKESDPMPDGDKVPGLILQELLGLIVGTAAIALGANLLIENGTLIAQALGVPESVIALTFVALGTSLPELVTAVTALLKGHGALSLGNIIGANLFNLVLVNTDFIKAEPCNKVANLGLCQIDAQHNHGQWGI